MNYITDYQLDIDEGFMCKVNDIPYHFDFKYSTQKHKYYISNILKLAYYLKIDRSELIGIFNSETAYDVIYCDSKQQCCDLCQHIVKTYFRPKQTETDKKEWCEKSRRYLSKYYLNDAIVKFDKYSFKLKPAPKGGWFWHCIDIGGISKDLWLQFTLNTDEVLTICNFLTISAYFHGLILIFRTPTDAIKFTDYLIETYIIKKEKTYDKNQLRKERTAISRGTKPTGNIIHGRRSKASVRCGCIEHKACLGN